MVAHATHGLRFFSLLLLHARTAWCYVGQRRLTKALEQFQSSSSSSSDTTVQVEWKPFQIDPGTAPEGEAYLDYNKRRWGSDGWTHHLRQEGKKDGALFAKWTTWPNTLKGHQFVQYALEKHGIPTDKTNQILFHCMYEEGANISLTETLVNIAQKHFDNDSWNWDELRTFLNQNQGAAAVQEEIARGRRQYRISGVPFFVIGRGDDNTSGRPYGLSGAQSSSTLLGVLQDVAQEMEDDDV